MKRILIIPIILSLSNGPFSLNAMSDAIHPPKPNIRFINTSAAHSHNILATIKRGKTGLSVRSLQDNVPSTIIQQDSNGHKAHEYTVIASVLNIVGNKATIECSIEKNHPAAVEISKDISTIQETISIGETPFKLPLTFMDGDEITLMLNVFEGSAKL
jgi:hypothetical protein